jgi:hypothetical protein
MLQSGAGQSRPRARQLTPCSKRLSDNSTRKAVAPCSKRRTAAWCRSLRFCVARYSTRVVTFSPLILFLRGLAYPLWVHPALCCLPVCLVHTCIRHRLRVISISADVVFCVTFDLTTMYDRVVGFSSHNITGSAFKLKIVEVPVSESPQAAFKFKRST